MRHASLLIAIGLAVAGCRPTDRRVATDAGPEAAACAIEPTHTRVAIVVMGTKGLEASIEKIGKLHEEACAPGVELLVVTPSNGQTSVKGGPVRAARAEGARWDVPARSREAIERAGRWLWDGAPTTRRLMVFFGHGRGLEGVGDGVPGGQLGITTMAAALSAARGDRRDRLDGIGFDACSMATWEVAAHLARETPYVIASPDLVPEDGWPYRELLSEIATERTPGWSTLPSVYLRQSPLYRRLSVLDTAGAAEVGEALASIKRTLDANGCSLPSDGAYLDSSRMDPFRLVRSAKQSCPGAHLAAERVERAVTGMVRHTACRSVGCDTSPVADVRAAR